MLEICFWREDRGNLGLPECMGVKGGEAGRVAIVDAV